MAEMIWHGGGADQAWTNPDNWTPITAPQVPPLTDIEKQEKRESDENPYFYEEDKS